MVLNFILNPSNEADTIISSGKAFHTSLHGMRNRYDVHFSEISGQPIFDNDHVNDETGLAQKIHEHRCQQ